MSYAELQCRTHYSFLRGASHPHELIDKAALLELSAIAITDWNGVYALPKAFQAAKQHTKLKLISGGELSLSTDDSLSVTILAENRQGYALLCHLFTQAHADQPKGQARLNTAQFFQMIQEAPTESQLSILLPLQGDRQFYKDMREHFNINSLSLTLSRFLDGQDDARTQKALSLKKEFGIPILATNDVHYHCSSKKPLQDILTATRLGVSIEAAGKRLFSNAERHLKSAQQMKALFSDLPTAIERSLFIAERCHFSLGELRYRYPSEWIPSEQTAQSYLESLVLKGAEKRYPSGIPAAVLQQLDHELNLIRTLDFADYFLTIWDIVEFARKKNILCQGRGSAANSAVCFCLGITAIDPVRMNLLFERFISVERGEPPDIDVDFENGRREEVIQYVYEKYGRSRAAMVAAVITYQPRSAERDISKALATSEHPDLQNAIKQSLTKELLHFPRHLSIHSGGFTLSSDPLNEIVPIEPARMPGRTIVQWDKNDLDILGLMKVDLLALGMLTAIQKTLQLLDPPLTLATIPAEDPSTYAMIQKADTIGVFQIESRAQMNMLPRLLPQNYYDLVIEVALVRPGPIVGDMVHPYLKRRRGLEPIDLPDQRLVPILARTLGVPLFQEQIMKIAISLAGFSGGEADQLRRAIGAWKAKGSLDALSIKLKEGLFASGLPTPFIELIFRQMQGFSEYGFPESHAASFALLAYASAYLKCHHPAEFTCALLNSQPMGFYSAHTLIDDAKRHGVNILPLNLQTSEWDCTLVPCRKAIQIGWRQVSGLSQKLALHIIQERQKSPFHSLEDFLLRASLPQQLLCKLAIANVFECFHLSPREALWSLLAWHVSHQKGQLDLFSSTPNIEPRADNSFPEMRPLENIFSDYRTFRLSTRGHPLQFLRDPRTKPTIVVKNSQHGQRERAAGLIIARQRPSTGKGTVFSTLEDEHGTLDLILHKDVYEKYRSLFRETPFLCTEGIIQRDGNSVSLLVKKMSPLFSSDEQKDFHSQSHDWR